MDTHSDTEQRASGGACLEQAPPKVWRLAISTLLGIGASFALLWVFDYSALGFFTVGVFWFMASMGTYRRFRRKS
jgi:hypothetical protein